MPRMRTAKGVLAIIKEQDPDSEITLSYIRRLIKQGVVPVTKVGHKMLVNADLLIKYIAAGNSEERVAGGITPVPV